MNVCIIGTGYVGLVTGACFAEFGAQVVCADSDAGKIAALQDGKIPIYEPGLEGLVERNVRQGRLSFTTDTAEAIRASLILFIAVPTPPLEDGSTDLTAVESVAREIGRTMDGYKVVVTKSTVPVGTSLKVRSWIEQEIAKVGGEIRFSVASNPEFLREGAAIGDFMRPDRVVIGTEDDQATAILSDLYRPLFLIETPVVKTNIATAELTKYAANAFLATKISFINEIANLCEAVGADVHSIARGIGLDRRIGSKFLHPGPGFGGSCFPKDTRSAVHFAREVGCELEIVESVIRVNERQRERMIDKIAKALGRSRVGRSGSWDFPSSPRPMTCAMRRRSTSSRGSKNWARGFRLMIPRRWKKRRHCFRNSLPVRTPTRLPAARTRWCSSPSGINFECWIFRGSKGC